MLLNTNKLQRTTSTPDHTQGILAQTALQYFHKRVDRTGDINSVYYIAVILCYLIVSVTWDLRLRSTTRETTTVTLLSIDLTFVVSVVVSRELQVYGPTPLVRAQARSGLALCSLSAYYTLAHKLHARPGELSFECAAT